MDAQSTTNRKFLHAAGKNVPLDRNGDFNFALRSAITVFPGNAIYTFIPKNACSTMRYSVAAANGILNDPSEVNWIHANNLTFQPSLREAYDAAFTFVILRCPYRRLYSLYMDKIVNIDIQSWELHNFAGRQIHPHDVTFGDFVEMLRRPRGLLVNHHWRPQADFLLYEKYDAYYSVERMAEAVADLDARIGLKVHDVRPFVSHDLSKLKTVEGNYVGAAAIDLLKLKRSGSVPSAQSLYDKDIRAAVANLYRQDIELYSATAGAAGLLFH